MIDNLTVFGGVAAATCLLLLVARRWFGRNVRAATEVAFDACEVRLARRQRKPVRRWPTGQDRATDDRRFAAYLVQMARERQQAFD